MSFTRRDIAELYVDELGRHPARHGLDLYLTKGYAFGRLPTGKARGHRLSSGCAPTRGRVLPGRARAASRPSSRLVDKLTGVRCTVSEMRARGAAPSDVQRWVATQTPYTLRQVFSACSDPFERACYAGGL